MKTDLHDQIRKHVIQYLTKRITLSKFHKLVMPIVLNVKDTEDREVLDSVYEIELLFAGYSEKYISESELRQRLASHFNHVVLHVFQPEAFEIKGGHLPFAARMITDDPWSARFVTVNPVKASWRPGVPVVAPRQLEVAW